MYIVFSEPLYDTVMSISYFINNQKHLLCQFPRRKQWLMPMSYSISYPFYIKKYLMPISYIDKYLSMWEIGIRVYADFMAYDRVYSRWNDISNHRLCWTRMGILGQNK